MPDMTYEEEERRIWIASALVETPEDGTDYLYQAVILAAYESIAVEQLHVACYRKYGDDCEILHYTIDALKPGTLADITAYLRGESHMLEYLELD